MRPKIAQKSSEQDSRQTILDACQALVLEHGYEQLSIRRLTEECGYTAPTIYHHFGDKRGLIDAMLEECFHRLLLRLRRVPRESDPVNRVRALLRVFIRFGLTNPVHYQLLGSRPPGDATPVKALEEARALLEAALRELHAAKRLVSDDEEAVFQSLWAMGHGIITLQTSHPDYAWSNNLVETALDGILHGVICVDPPQRSESRP